MPRPLRSYDLVANSYEFTSRVFSAGGIPASKHAQLPHIGPGDRVLYLGVGSGEDAFAAAKKGAAVTCVDTSPAMLARLRRRLERADLSAELLCEDAFELHRPGEYDAVAANYFLNVFRRDGMRRMLRHALTFLKPGGKFLIADVAPAEGNVVARAVNLAYLKSAMASFWALRLVPWHENYDYTAELEAAGLTVTERHGFRLAGVGPVVYQTLIAERP